MDSFVVRTKRKSSSKPLRSQSSEVQTQGKSSFLGLELDQAQENALQSSPKKLKIEISQHEDNEKKQETKDINNCLKSTDTPVSHDGKIITSHSKGISLPYSPKVKDSLSWRKIRGENLNCDYCRLLSKDQADELLQTCEKSITFNTGRMAQVQMFGQWRDIPRKQVAYGDPGLSYNFSGKELPARPWPPYIEKIRDHITDVTGQRFNFVLVNRYENGNDHIGEHRDDEKDLVRTSPIASLSLGQPRDFIFKHAASRGKDATRKIPTVTVELEHGSLLSMNYPTNIHWYHSLPKRKRALGVRINMTFRDFVVKNAN